MKPACLKALPLILAALMIQPGCALLAQKPPPKRIAAVVTEYRHNSHADVIVGRLIESYTLDGKGEFPNLKLVSLYTDQVPKSDSSRELMKKHGVPIYTNITQALTLGSGKLAVDGVLLVAEHGVYPTNSTGNVIWPKRRMFDEIQQVFRQSGRSVPVFCDKHLSDNWADAKWMYDTARELKAPLMAGSSLPVLWRYPAADTKRGATLKELVVVSYHTLDAYGFHALEMVQCLAERRAGGETGVRSVKGTRGEAVWQAARDGVFDRALMDAALGTLKHSPISRGGTVEQLAKDPILCTIEYRDGTRAHMITLNGAVGEWAAAWRTAEGPKITATNFFTQEARPFMHFTHLLKGVEKMFHTGEPAWPVERTLISSAVLDALLISLKDGGRRVETPYLDIKYTTLWNWQQPPPMPPDRPIPGQ